jgi:MFS family permease
LSLKGDNVGVSVPEIGYAFSAGYMLDSFLFAPVGWAMDVYGRKACGVPAFFVLALGLFMIPMVSSAQGLLVVSTVMAVGNGLSSGLLMTIGTDLAPRAYAGEFIGVWHLVCDAGALCGPLLLGIVSDVSSLDMSAWVCAIVGVVGGSWYYLGVAETLLDTSL